MLPDRHVSRLLAAVSLVACAPWPAQAQSDDTAALDELRARIDQQEQRLKSLRNSLEREEADLRTMQRAVNERVLASQRGGQAAPGVAAGAAVPAPSSTVAAAPVDAAPGATISSDGGGTEIAAVGRAPDTSSTPLGTVAPIFEQPGVLTPRGSVTLEPSIQYGYSSNNRVALLGYTVIPAITIGLIDVREVRRTIVTGALTARYGLTNRLEVEARVPYVYRKDDTVSREFGAGAADERVFSADGHHLGDIELATRYQFNEGSAEMPYFIGSLRYKTRTGKSPFDVVTDCIQRCIGDTENQGTGLPLDLPTGSGFDSLQAGLTWLYPSDPAVLFGNFTYLHNFKRHVRRLVRDGDREDLGEIEPGGVFGVNFGIGLALNDKSSMSLGYDHQSVGKTRQDGDDIAGAVRMQLATLLVGYSYRLDAKRSIGLSLGAGLTRDTPDATLTLRMPFTF